MGYKKWHGFIAALGFAGALVASATAANAQDYPTRPVKIVVAAGAGGGLDILVRLVKPEMEKLLGQPIIVDNKPGASGIIAVQSVTRAEPDGYSLLFVTGSTMSINPFVIKDLPYKPLEDLVPVAAYGTLPMFWGANPGKKFTSLKDVIAYARAKPGDLKVAHGGAGQLPNLLEEAFMRRHKLNVAMIPYKTSPLAANDAVAGHVDITVDNVSSLSGFFSSGQLTPLATTTRKRAKAFPTVPSWLEDDLGPMEMSGWYGFTAPKGTPPAIVAKLNRFFNEAIQSPAVMQRLDQLGMDFSPQSPEQFGAFMREDYEKFRKLTSEIGLATQ